MKTEKGGPPVQFPQHLAREALLENLHHGGRCAALWFGDEQMNVLRHDDVSNHGEVIAPPNFLKKFEKQVPAASRAKQRAAAKTA